jgi:hypothetical protein
MDGANENEYNGAFSVVVDDANTFHYTVAGSPATPATGTITAYVPLTSNRKWELDSIAGNATCAGTFTGSTVYADFAEYFENYVTGEIGMGVLITLVDLKAKVAGPGDIVDGVVSGTAGIILGDSPFAWAKRYLTDDWGRIVYEDVIDPESGQTVSVPKENPDYDATVQNVPRSSRPDEWTCMAEIGQVHVRVASDVIPGDWLEAGEGGVAVKANAKTNLRAMKIKKEFDTESGYAIAICFLK